MRQATPFANCTILIGHPLVLANPDTGAEQQLYATNAANCPVFASTAEWIRCIRDSVVPFVRMYEKAGVDIVHHIHPEPGTRRIGGPRSVRCSRNGHRPARARHIRDTLVGDDRTDRYNREKWLVINALGKRASDVALPDVNTVEAGAGSVRCSPGNDRADAWT